MDILNYIDASPSPYHAVATTAKMLREAGFSALREEDAWDLKPGGRYYTTRGGRTIIAWQMGTKTTAETGARILGAHTDSPVLKLRPNPSASGRGMGLLTTEIYGSPLLHTWLDRDLKLCGALYVKTKTGVEPLLIDATEFSLRLNSLAPHLRKDKSFDGLVIDKHKDLAAVLSGPVECSKTELLRLLTKPHGLTPDDVLDFDLMLADRLPCALVGANEEFISAPRLDNLFSCYVGLKALIGTAKKTEHTSLLCLYDSEEIGSQTWTGARSDPFTSTFERIGHAYGLDADKAAQARARSVFVSADMAHAEHYAFKDVTDEKHVPTINEGLAVKSGARGNYAIGYPAMAWFKHVCADAGLTLQTFMYRCDHGAGSSVGPMVTTGSGICGIDVGSPMLAMHSIRELAGIKDVDLCEKAFAAFYASKVPFPSTAGFEPGA